MMKCGRCGAEINGNKCSAMTLKPQYSWLKIAEKFKEDK